MILLASLLHKVLCGNNNLYFLFSFFFFYILQDRCDARGVPGWDAIDNLAEYLVNLNCTITALSITETTEIVQLYSCLHDMDKRSFKYHLKSRKETLPGPWKASRKRSGSAPGQQVAER